MLAFGIDIGGTNIRCALCAIERTRVQVRAAWRFSTPRSSSLFLQTIGEAIVKARQLSGRTKIVGVGIGIPGPVAPDRRHVDVAPNAPQIHRIFLPEWITEHFALSCRMENDADVFTRAEALFGNARGFSRVLGVTVGTGLGAGLVEKGHIIYGAHGAAGEMGHMVVKIGGRRCSCGGRGHLEEYVSHRAFLRLGNDDPKALLRRARNGEQRARAAFEKIGTVLGIGVASAVNFWDPDIVIVGGGIGSIGRFLLQPAQSAMRKEIISPLVRRHVRIKKAAFGRFGGAIGAASLLLKRKQ